MIFSWNTISPFHSVEVICESSLRAGGALVRGLIVVVLHVLLEVCAPPALVAAPGLPALVGILLLDLCLNFLLQILFDVYGIYENHQVSLAVVLVGGCPALGPVAAHDREAAVGHQATQQNFSADLGALLKWRRRFSIEKYVGCWM